MIYSRRSSLYGGVLMTTLGALTLLGGQAHADLVFIANGASGGVFNYNLNFSTNVDAGTGLPAQRLQAGNFATIYDIFGFTGFTLNPADAGLFTVTSQNVGITPPGTAPGDNATLTNLTVTYQGGTLTADQSFANLLQVNSTFNTVNPNGQYTSSVTKNTGLDAGTAINSIGSVAVPGVAATPEPGSVALFVGAGLSGSVFAFRRRRSRK